MGNLFLFGIVTANERTTAISGKTNYIRDAMMQKA
jgi:hypothetical protein